MAGYNYMNEGGYCNDRDKSSCGGGGGSECSDHVCRPVIIDAEGRKRPFIAQNANHGSSESYVATSTGERVAEHVIAPVVVTEYRYITQAKVEPMNDYGVTTDKWGRPLSPAHDPQDVVTEFGYGYPAEAEPVKNYGVTSDKWSRPSAPHRQQVVVTDYGYGAPTKVEPVKDYGVTNEVPRPSSLVLNHPREVDQFFFKVQTEASRPRRPGLLSATNWRNMPNSASQGGYTSYGEYTNYDDSDDWNKPSGRQTLTNKEGSESPGSKFGTAPPSRDSTPLCRPTNDIGKAMEILKEAAKSSPVTAATASPQPWFNAPASTVIDSREAARRYGNLNPSHRPFQTGETYTGIIDSREAARKYNGTME